MISSIALRLGAPLMAAVGAATGFTTMALAGAGQPTPGQLGMQDPVTRVAADIRWFHDSWVNPIIVAIALFVLVLLIYVMLRFNAKSNPTPSKTSHNTALEFAWTVIPVVILIAIGIPSFKLLYLQYSYPPADLTMKAVGNAWFWEHEYPDQGVKVTSNMIRDEDVLKQELGEAEFAKRYGTDLDALPVKQKLYDDAKSLYAKFKYVRQLSVDNDIAVPVGKVVHLLITSNDVIHSWTIPSFGSKMQAVPGRTTATWFQPTKEGVYYGQCSVLCGKEHASMPIAVRVVSQKAFDDWIAAAKARNWKRAREILAAATEGQPARTVAELSDAAN
jgi:cytochrome c oxidase subunit 2